MTRNLFTLDDVIWVLKQCVDWRIPEADEDVKAMLAEALRVKRGEPEPLPAVDAAALREARRAALEAERDADFWRRKAAELERQLAKLKAKK